MSQGWDYKPANIISYTWADSTLRSYNKAIDSLKRYCSDCGTPFPPMESRIIANYLCALAATSDRPKSVINITLAALTSLYQVSDMPNPCGNNIRSLCNALVKTHTTRARKRTPILPVEPFNKLFISWKSNADLPLRMLRLKAITLLAFAFMLRPSDIAPKGVFYDSERDVLTSMVFSRSQVFFPSTGGVTLTFFGIKNDSTRDGFEVAIPASSNETLDPASCLRVYMERTRSLRGAYKSVDPVFLSLKRPYDAISAATVGGILQESIELAGLDTNTYSAKCFRPTAATRAVSSFIDPDKARRIGRWKTSSVFYEHYVFDQTPDNYEDNIFNV